MSIIASQHNTIIEKMKEIEQLEDEIKRQKRINSKQRKALESIRQQCSKLDPETALIYEISNIAIEQTERI